MLSSSLKNIAKILNDSQLNISEDKINKFIKILKIYKKDYFIYCLSIARQTGMTINETCNILNILCDAGFLKLCYELYCSYCQESVNLLYETFNSIPEEFECNECGMRNKGLENAYIVYKVIKDE